MTQRKRTATPGVTSVSAWKESAGPLLELPSGKTVKVMQHPSMRVFLKAGIIPNSLVSIIQSSLDRGQAPDLASFGATQERIDEMFKMIDSIVCFTVEEPDIQLPPDKEEDRDAGVLYADEVEQTDKLFVFQWAIGGTRDLERFRRESGTTLDLIQRGKDVVGETIPDARTSRARS